MQGDRRPGRTPLTGRPGVSDELGEIEVTWSTPTLPPVDVVCPTSLEELLQLAAAGRRPFAGGTDVLVQAARQGHGPPPLAWTGSVAELAGVERRGGALRIGAAATLARVASSAAVRTGAPALAEAAGLVGSVQIRNVATAMGNLCNASPAADTAPALVVHDATVEIERHGVGGRTVAVEHLAEGPGRTSLSEGEVASWISVGTVRRREWSAYRRFTVRRSMDLAFVGVAARIALEDSGDRIRSARIALGAVAPTVVVAREAAAVLTGVVPDEAVLREAGRAAAAAARPIDDLRASAAYRRRLVEVMVGDVVLSAWRSARGETA